ncbi:shikimate kinase [Microbacterium deminutum]|uniref:Shikimate kinase n=1 Tax=Microbacterium deminutum TaxID=344164 RepID=A0ABP5BSX0_9MICO
MTRTSTEAIVLVGPMGAGKSSIGRRVARELGLPFTDTDTLVVRDHGPIAQLFATQGEAGFREMERGAVQEALARGGVVALGGGAILDPATRTDLGAHHVVLLTVSPQIVKARIQGARRPLLADGDDPVARWEAIVASRSALYAEVADVTFDTSHGPLALVVKDIVSWARHMREGRGIPANGNAWDALSEGTETK